LQSRGLSGHERCGVEGIKFSNTHSGWEVRNSWDKNISAWDFEPIEGNYISCQIAFKIVGFAKVKYQVEEAYRSVILKYLSANLQRGFED
jgi:hypothetical protein